jgi:hypothetical protein
MTYEQFGSNGGVPQYADYDDQSDEGLPEPESVLGNALTRFEAEWEAGLREKALVEERKRAEVGGHAGLSKLQTSGEPFFLKQSPRTPLHRLSSKVKRTWKVLWQSARP